MEQLAEMILSVAEKLLEGIRYLFTELGPFAWLVCVLVPVIILIGCSSLLKTRIR